MSLQMVVCPSDDGMRFACKFMNSNLKFRYMDKKLPYVMPSVEQLAVTTERGLAVSDPAGSTTDTIDEVNYAGSSSDFWN